METAVVSKTDDLHDDVSYSQGEPANRVRLLRATRVFKLFGFSAPFVNTVTCVPFFGEILAVTMRKVLTGALIFAFICLSGVFASENTNIDGNVTGGTEPTNTTIASDMASGNGTAPNTTASIDDAAMNVTASANNSNTSTNGTTNGASGDLTGAFASENTTEASTTTLAGGNANAIELMNTTVSSDMASGNGPVTNTMTPRDDAAMNVTASANSSNTSTNDTTSVNNNTSNGPTSGDLTGAVNIKPPSQETKPSGEVPKSGIPNLVLAPSCFISTSLALFAIF
ncbi:hypothetical protein SprV_0401429400 [Sparganum proliferum]